MQQPATMVQHVPVSVLKKLFPTLAPKAQNQSFTFRKRIWEILRICAGGSDKGVWGFVQSPWLRWHQRNNLGQTSWIGWGRTLEVAAAGWWFAGKLESRIFSWGRHGFSHFLCVWKWSDSPPFFVASFIGTFFGMMMIKQWMEWETFSDKPW